MESGGETGGGGGAGGGGGQVSVTVLCRSTKIGHCS